ncbi:ABC transporter substrate-binding protein [Rhizobiaceae bacterium BDR2-2]|uniref:ABC transporter substrate-binding protein n=1 Tax=Ectorhizobium quercum TaxID=2965071 RepID=A0AAE3N0F7_9HYPH|nr:ABC transporter substrate-binding protein [Ectorhizobium quercum]MCX8997439.1 ABC transporter substrate-binding protein [Ectorhizobium quercum]
MISRTFKPLRAAAVALTLLSGTALAGPADNSLVWSTDREVNLPFVWWDTTSEIATTMHHVFDTLVYRNPETLEYEPLLATSWSWVDDRTLEFVLREGVTFHDGTPFGADDVVDTFAHLTDPAAKVLNASLVNWVESVEKLDEYRIRIHMAKPYPAALEFLAGSRDVILPSEAWAGLPTAADGTRDYTKLLPVGTGPYRMTEFRPGESFTLTRNEAYFDGPKGKPAIGTIVFRTIPDQETRLAELMVGNVDWLMDVPPDMAEQLSAMPELEVVEGPDLRFAYIALDRTARAGLEPLKDVRVRRAIAHAIDRQAIASALVGPGAKVIDAACFPTQVGCTDDVARYEYDPEKAKALLAEAGYADGFTLPLGAYRERPQAEAVIGYLRSVGIPVNLRYMQWVGLREEIVNNRLPAALRTWASSGLNDVIGSASVLLKMQPDDLCQSPEIAAALEKGDTTVDPDARKAAYAEAFRMIADEVCWVPLYTYAKLYAYSDKLDFHPTQDGFPLFYTARWKD